MVFLFFYRIKVALVGGLNARATFTSHLVDYLLQCTVVRGHLALRLMIHLAFAPSALGSSDLAPFAHDRVNATSSTSYISLPPLIVFPPPPSLAECLREDSLDASQFFSELNVRP